MSENSDIKTRLKEMAQLSVLSNRISEIQEVNLKAYPFVFFNGVKEVRLSFDLSKVNDDGSINSGDYHHVTYELKVEGEQDNLDVRLSHLEKAVRALFWNDLKVKIFINGHFVFESKKDVRPTSS